MIRLMIKHRGQSTLEYAILIVVVIMALIGIQAYLKRGIQGGMRGSADQIGDQFDPSALEGNIRTESGGTIGEYGTEESKVTTYGNQWSRRSGEEITTGNLSYEYAP
ncbi:hypothetical protein ACFL2J_00250 [Candidatus Omnitrophota bacterium]